MMQMMMQMLMQMMMLPRIVVSLPLTHRPLAHCSPMPAPHDQPSA